MAQVKDCRFLATLGMTILKNFIFDCLLPVDQARHVRRPKSVIYIHHAYVARAGVQHSEQCGQTFEGGAVADAGGDGDYGDSDQASDYARESAFHAGANDDDSGFGEDTAVG